METTLLNILKEVRPDIDFLKQESLISKGIIDSFDMISIISNIEENMGIQIDIEDINEENFASYEKMLLYLQKKGGGNRMQQLKKWEDERKKFNLKYPSEEVVRFLYSNYKEQAQDKIIIDAGCGSGRNIFPMVDLGFKKIIAIDASEQCIKLTKEKFKNIDNIEYIVNEIGSVDFEYNSIDCLVLFGFAMLVDNKTLKSILKKIYPSLKKNAKLLIDFRTKQDYLYGKGEEIGYDVFLLDERAENLSGFIYKFYDREEIENLIDELGFCIDYMEEITRTICTKENKTSQYYCVYLSKK